MHGSERLQRAFQYEVAVRLMRDGREMSLDVQLGERREHLHSYSRSFVLPDNLKDSMGAEWRLRQKNKKLIEGQGKD